MNIYELTHKYISKGTPVVVVSAVEKQGDGPVEVGKKMLVLKENEAFGTVGGGALEYEAREYAKEIFTRKKSETKTYLLNEGQIIDNAMTLPMACGGKVTLYYEYIGPSEYVYIFGAGHCSQALTKILDTLNYHVTVIDQREDVINQFTGANEVVLSPFAKYIEDYGLVEDSFVVVATPSHKYDYDVIDTIIKKQLKLKYYGMLCSKKKLVDYLDQTFETYGKDIDLSNFYSPVGLDTGGGSPEEIAISISAEILAVSNNKTNHKHMRERNAKYRYWEK